MTHKPHFMKDFQDDCRGAIAIIAALLMIPLIAFVGIAVDAARLYAVRAQLEQATDAAALAGGRLFYMPQAVRDAKITDYFNENIQETRYGETVATPVIVEDTDAGTLTVTATADVPMTLMRVLGFTTLPVSSLSEVTRQDTKLELALALDVTGSMLNGCANCTGSKLNTLKLAVAGADGMLDILFGNSVNDPNLSIGIVPFTNVVNIGTNNAGFLEPGSMNDSTPAHNPLDWNGAVTGLGAWGGCVFERPSPNDIGDAPPVVGTQFHPFYAGPLGHYTTTAVIDSEVGQYEAWWTHNTVIAGHNYYNYDFTANGLNAEPPGTPPDANKMHWKYVDPISGAVKHAYEGCYPPPVTPLTSDKATLVGKVNALVGQGNTMTTVGSAWGWRLISPNWRGVWGGVAATKPADYGTQNNTKAMVLMTDGENNVTWWNGYGTHLECTPLLGAAGPCWGDGVTGGDYDAAVAQLNQRQLDICSDMKAQGIRIYTIAFGLPAGASVQKTVLTQCATSPGLFFDANTGLALQTAFRAIASDLVALRLSK